VANVPIPQARARAEQRAAELGLDAADAALLADHLLDAELCGASSHGIERMRWLHKRGRRGDARVRLLERGEGVARYDGYGTLGYISLAHALDAELAEPLHGARLVTISHCFPTGRLGYFAERAARSGAVCLLTATSVPRIVHHDGGPPIVGTNPLCLALPGDPDPTVVDVSMGRVTFGGVLAAEAVGKRLPEGSAALTDGTETRDPGDVLADRAGILPMGGEQAYKGFALALLVDLLGGALLGTDGYGAVALLAEPQADPVPGFRGALDGRRMPGDGSAARRAAATARGSVDLPDDLWAWLNEG
jgi:LDH2 family malate/lactate/ureidoglycolate dehydrogenase